MFECNVDKVRETMPVTTDIVDLMVQKITSLNHKGQLILVIAATLGHTFKSDVLEPLMASVELVSLFPSKLAVAHEEPVMGANVDETFMSISSKVLTKALSSACKVGLLERTKVKYQYRFTHDRVQQSAIALLPAGERGGRIKALLGSLMLELCETYTSESWMLYTATNLILKTKITETCRLLKLPHFV